MLTVLVITRPGEAHTILPTCPSGTLLMPPHISFAALELLYFCFKILHYRNALQHTLPRRMLVVLRFSHV